MCEGKKAIPQLRCPNSTLEPMPYVSDAFRAYAFFKNHGVLPIDGGMLDQSSFFVRVVEFCDSLAPIYNDRREAKEERLREMAAKAKNGTVLYGDRKNNRGVRGSAQ